MQLSICLGNPSRMSIGLQLQREMQQNIFRFAFEKASPQRSQQFVDAVMPFIQVPCKEVFQECPVRKPK